MATIPPFVKNLIGQIHIGTKRERSSDLSFGAPVFISQGLDVREKQTEGVRSNIVVILTAREVEYVAVRQHLSRPIKEIRKGRNNRRIYEHGRFRSGNRLWDIMIREIGEFNVNATLQTVHAITDFNPKMILFVGTAGGREDKVAKGDVVVAPIVYNGMAAKISPGESKASPKMGFRPASEKSDEALISIAKVLRTQKEQHWRDRIKPRLPSGWSGRTKGIPRNDPHVYVEPLISTDLVWSEVESELYKKTALNIEHAVAREMEGFGFLSAANDGHTAATVIRGIADFMLGKDEIDKEGWKEVAMLNASAFAFALIAKFSDS